MATEKIPPQQRPAPAGDQASDNPALRCTQGGTGEPGDSASPWITPSPGAVRFSQPWRRVSGTRPSKRPTAAVERAPDLLFASPAGRYCDTLERMLANVRNIVEMTATGHIDPRRLFRFDMLEPEAKARLVSLNGETVLTPRCPRCRRRGPSGIGNGRPISRRAWEAQLRGKSEGDGAIWASGEDFLKEFWATLEKRTATLDTRAARDPVSSSFRNAMPSRPTQRVMYRYLRRAGLRPQDIRSRQSDARELQAIQIKIGGA